MKPATLGQNEINELLEIASPFLLLVVADADHFSRTKFGKHLLVTSVIRPKTNDSGVHSLGRACDVRTHDPINGATYFNDSEISQICDYINAKYPYGKGLLTAFAHQPGQIVSKPTLDNPFFVSPTATAAHLHFQVSNKM